MTNAIRLTWSKQLAQFLNEAGIAYKDGYSETGDVVYIERPNGHDTDDYLIEFFNRFSRWQFHREMHERSMESEWKRKVKEGEIKI